MDPDDDSSPIRCTVLCVLIH